MLSESEFEAFLAPLEPAQAECVRWFRSLILAGEPPLREKVSDGKWYRGLLVYQSQDDITVYALGPLSGGYTTFHSMAYYGFPALQERQAKTLGPLASGKSCFKARRREAWPEDAIRDLIAAAPAYLESARNMLAAR